MYAGGKDGFMDDGGRIVNVFTLCYCLSNYCTCSQYLNLLNFSESCTVHSFCAQILLQFTSTSSFKVATRCTTIIAVGK